jgi:hypothetical protein
MIRHISIPATNPRHVASVLAELLNGRTTPFPGHAGSYLALAWDEEGTMIEVYPMGTELTPGHGDAQVEFQENQTYTQFHAIHAAIDIPVSEEKIKEVATREGWRVLRCNRGLFELIELWVENHLLLELLTPEMAPEYIKFMQPQNLEQMFAGMKA